MRCKGDNEVIWSWSGEGKRQCKKDHDGSEPSEEKYPADAECDVSLEAVQEMTRADKKECKKKCEQKFKIMEGKTETPVELEATQKSMTYRSSALMLSAVAILATMCIACCYYTNQSKSLSE